MKKNRFNGIQALRFFACFLVLFQHLVFYTLYGKGFGDAYVLPINFGRIGVCLFFLISGFVMGFCLDQGKWFLINRALRIFPPYWLAIFASWVVFVPMGNSWSLDWVSFFLFPTNLINYSYRIPYWTLCYEMAFYFVMYIIILLRVATKNILRICVVWLVVIVYFDLLRQIGNVDSPEVFEKIAQPGLRIFFSPYAIFFIIGLFSSFCQFNFLNRLSTGVLVLFAIFALVVGEKFEFNFPSPMFLIQSCGFVCLLFAANRVSFPSFIVKLGDYSYGIYLVHIIAIASVLAFMQPFISQIAIPFVFVLFLLVALAIGVIFGFVEYRIHYKLRKSYLKY